VEKIPPIEPQPAATKPPVSPEKVVKLENTMLFFIQHAPAHQAEIGYVLLVFSSPDHPAGPASGEFQRYPAHVFFPGRTLTETLKACFEDCTEDAIAGRRLSSPANVQSETVALGTAMQSQA
jgi:hypothetical protein